MRKIEELTSSINKALEIGESHLKSQESIQKNKIQKRELEAQLMHDTLIRIPFVGDFSAGKSSLINSMLGCKLLPTNIEPETAVSYELYYSTDQRLELKRSNDSIERVELSQINDLKTSPGDVVKVYLDNQQVKSWNEKNLVIVDMPGIDSGIEAHNNAILNYIQEGTHFFVFIEADQGTMRSSTSLFIKEIQKYGLETTVVISKSDKKPEDELNAIKSQIESQTKSLIGEGAKVCVTSAAMKEFSDVTTILNSIDAEGYIEKRYNEQVNLFINQIISELELQIKLLYLDKKDFSEKIKQLQEQKEKAIKELKRKDSQSQPLEDSAQDILDDVKEALMSNADNLARQYFNSPKDNAGLNAEILSIIRPVLVNSFKREISEYQDVVGECLADFSAEVNNILSSDNPLGQLGGVGDMLDNKMVESLLKKGLDMLLKRFAGYKSLTLLLTTLSKFLGPLAGILLNILPDIFNWLFGDGAEKKIAKIKEKLVSSVFSRILQQLEPTVIAQLAEQRKSVMDALEQLILEETQKYDQNIQELIKQQQAEQIDKEKEVLHFQKGISDLQQLILA